MVDVKSDSGLAAFNETLAAQAFATGYVFLTAFSIDCHLSFMWLVKWSMEFFSFAYSGEDSSLFEALGSAPNAAKYPNVARWYKHIASFEKSERASWPSAGGWIFSFKKCKFSVITFQTAGKLYHFISVRKTIIYNSCRFFGRCRRWWRGHRPLRFRRRGWWGKGGYRCTETEGVSGQEIQEAWTDCKVVGHFGREALGRWDRS